MIKVNLKEAEGDLEHLIHQAAGGEEVIITRRDGARFRIVPLPLTVTDPVAAKNEPRLVGNSLDKYMGIWSAEEAEEFLKAIAVFDKL